MGEAAPFGRCGFRQTEIEARVGLARRQGMARGPVHHRRPADDHGAPQLAPHRAGLGIPQSRRTGEARRGAPCIPAGARRPAGGLQGKRAGAAAGLNQRSQGRRGKVTYFEGFIVPVPEDKKDAYRQMAAGGAPIFQEFGVQRHIEAWESDVPEGKVTDFHKAVDAKPDEKVVFSWFEYPSREARDGANAKIMSDPRMKEMGNNMPFDGKRMIMGGFDAIVEEGSGSGGYTDGFVVPVPEAKREAYRELAAKMAKVFRQHGALRVVEAISDDVPKGEVTDFYRAVNAEDGEKVVFSFIEWPDKATRDTAWEKIMSDESLKPEGEMPFAGQRMFWGGFEPIHDTAGQQQTSQAQAPITA